MVIGGKVQLITINVHGNLPVPLVSKNPYDIRAWNGKVDEYIVGVFDFDQMFLDQMFLAFDGVVLLFHPYYFRVLKEVKSYLENNGFFIWMKLVVANSLPIMSSEIHISRFHINPLNFLCIFLLFNFN